MKTQYLYILVIILIILSTGLIISVKFNYQLCDSLKANKQELSEKDIELYSVLWAMNQQYKNTGKRLADFNILANKQRYPFSSFLKDKYELFYKFSLGDCSTCIETELKNIKENADFIKILIETSNSRDFKTFLTINHIDTTKAFLIEKPILEEAELPFYFISNKQLCIRDFFSPIKEVPELTIKYYQAMQDKYID